MTEELPPNEAPPRPRRRWRWVLLSLALILVVLLGGHLYLTRSAHSRLAEQVNAYRAAGEPILLQDFVHDPPPDQDNAALDLRAAARLLDPQSENWQEFYRDFGFELPLTERELADVESLVRDHQESIDLVELAATKPAAHWGINYATPAIYILLPDLGPQRELAMFVAAAALAAHARGDDATALRRIDQLFAQTEAVSHHPFLVGHLVTIGIEALTNSIVEQVSPRLRIGPEPGAARPEQVRALIDRLLDEQAIQASLHRSVLSERMAQLDSGMAVADGRMSLGQLRSGRGVPADGLLWGVLRPLAKPLLLNDTRLMIEHTTAVAAATESVDYPAFLGKRPAFPLKGELSEVWRHPLASILLSSFDRAVMAHHWRLAERRMTAVSLAARWYTQEHGGKLPETLGELVPKYLPAVPLDPFTPGKPLAYYPGPAIVYSVGDNGTDDGGSEQPTNPSLPNSSGRWQRFDAVMHLTPQPRPPEEPEADE